MSCCWLLASRSHKHLVSVGIRALYGVPDALTHTTRAVPRCRELQFLERNCKCAQVKCDCPLGRCFACFTVVAYRVPQIYTNFGDCSTSKLSVKASDDNLANANLGRTASCYDEPLWAATCSLLGTKQPKVQACRSSGGGSHPDNYLDILFTRKPGDRGWIISSVPVGYDAVVPLYV